MLLSSYIAGFTLPVVLVSPQCVQIRGELAEKEIVLLQKEKELLEKEQTLLVLSEEVCVGRSFSEAPSEIKVNIVVSSVISDVRLLCFSDFVKPAGH